MIEFAPTLVGLLVGCLCASVAGYALVKMAHARAAGEECAHRLAACDEQRISQQGTLSKMTALARELETKLRDCTDPPISREELKKLARALATARAERDALRIEVEKYRPVATA